jgi:NitT/TauT family transport system substrate-binding protein
MKSKILKLTSLAAVFILCLVLVAGCGEPAQEGSQPAELIPKLTLVGPAGPMAIPLAYLVENNKLGDLAAETELMIWENPDQLKAIVSGGEEAHFLTLPSNSAATFYNKGMNLKMLGISVWGILYVVSTDPDISAIEDLKGKEVVVPYQGNMPDLLFSFICEKKGIDTSKDLTVYYANSPQQAAQLLLSGQKTCSVLTEPLTTQVLMKAKKAGMSLYRSIDMQVEWSQASGLGERIPIAGTVALPAIHGNSTAITRFMEEYALAIEWLKENPDEAGILGSEIEQLGFETEPVAESVKNTRWNFIQVKDCRQDIDAFFNALADFDPAVIGGKLPDEGFYHEAIEIE